MTSIVLEFHAFQNNYRTAQIISLYSDLPHLIAKVKIYNWPQFLPSASFDRSKKNQNTNSKSVRFKYSLEKFKFIK